MKSILICWRNVIVRQRSLLRTVHSAFVHHRGYCWMDECHWWHTVYVNCCLLHDVVGENDNKCHRLYCDYHESSGFYMSFSSFFVQCCTQVLLAFHSLCMSVLVHSSNGCRPLEMTQLYMNGKRDKKKLHVDLSEMIIIIYLNRATPLYHERKFRIAINNELVNYYHFFHARAQVRFAA